MYDALYQWAFFILRITKKYLTNKCSKLSIKLELIPTNLGISGMAPEIYADTPEVEADEGYFVTLSCSAGGSPRPTIFWTRGGSTVSLLFDNRSFVLAMTNNAFFYYNKHLMMFGLSIIT